MHIIFGGVTDILTDTLSKMINFYGGHSRINLNLNSTQHSAVYNPQNGGFYIAIQAPKGAYKSLSCGLKHPLHRRAEEEEAQGPKSSRI